MTDKETPPATDNRRLLRQAIRSANPKRMLVTLLALDQVFAMSDKELPLATDDRRLLTQVIKSANPKRMLVTLLALRGVPEAATLMEQLLLSGYAKKPDSGSRAHSRKRALDQDSSSESTGHPSRKRFRYHICAHCDAKYDVRNNPADACRWHSGKWTRTFMQPGSLLATAVHRC